jgi:hypothetical protein
MARCGCIAILLLSACTPAQRFADRAVLWKDVDDRPIPAPAEFDPGYHWMAMRDALVQPLDRVLALDYGREAVNVNAVDEVPDSTWWRDRRRRPGEAVPRHFSDEEMARGELGTRPWPQAPFSVVKSKDSGGSLGFVVEDALGRRFAVKVDPPGLVGLGTSTEVVVSRLAWAAGWNVPAESLRDVRPEELLLSPKATMTAADGKTKLPLDRARWETLLARAPRNHDGSIRVLMSLWIEGKVIGPSSYWGRRADDPNDRIPHQDRRDLRGWGVFCAWVNNIDSTDINTMDSWVGRDGLGHVVHWQQDVGGSFGARPTGTVEYWMGRDTYVPWSRILLSFVTLGMWPRPWEGDDLRQRRAKSVATHPAIGFFDGIGFDPQRWHPIFDNPAFVRATARDRYWAAKQIVAIDARELRAAIAQGRYRADTAERLFQVLWQRRDAIARTYLSKVAALDHLRIAGGRLCWDDLWIAAGLDGEGSAKYRADGREQAERCVSVDGKGYRIVTLAAKRQGESRFGPELRVHLVDRRIVGVER